jgi:hypothetical protein
MKGDFSRYTFDPGKHYSGVLMQQGRVQTDADWNEQEAIIRRRTQIEACDVIGLCGAPKDNAGFKIMLDGGNLTIGKGRYYVDGILCENDVEGGLLYETQPNFPKAPKWQEILEKNKAIYGLVYLDVWERHITPLDDARLREVALDGPDTAHRVQTVWQVKVLPLGANLSPDEIRKLKAEREELKKQLDQTNTRGKLAEAAKIKIAVAEIDVQLIPPVCEGRFKEWDDLVGDPARSLNARTTTPTPGAGPCAIAPTAGYRGLENQLYRVEVHSPGTSGDGATFKWSRDNGSVVTAIEKISGKEITVHDLGPDEVLGFKNGQWVEVSDDALELAGKPGQLVQIDSIDTTGRKILLKSAVTLLGAGADGVDKARHPKLRRWDQDGVVSITNGWLKLENGVEVQFSNNQFKTGDYWLIPARTATGEIEWPPYEVPNKTPQVQPPLGLKHHYCRLALLSLDEQKKAWVVSDDCRKLFSPLTEPCCNQTALHVIATNWNNDDLFSFALVNRDGFRISLDTPPDPASLTNDTVLVAIEFPVMRSGKTSHLQYQWVYIRGIVGRDPNDPRIIVWKPQMEKLPPTAPRGGRARAAEARLKPMEAMIATMLPAAGFTLINFLFKVRITLKGYAIWNERANQGDALIHLDGRALGKPGLRADRKTLRIDLKYPSGDGANASDFESWLYLGKQKPAKEPLQVKTVRFLRRNGTPSSAGDVSPPLPHGTTVGFKAGQQVTRVEVEFNRAIEPKSLGSDKLPSIFMDRVGDKKIFASLKLVSDNTVVRCTLRDPKVFEKGRYTLTCLGTKPAVAEIPAILSQDDGTNLDGDYDNQPGDNFVLPFEAY